MSGALVIHEPKTFTWELKQQPHIGFMLIPGILLSFSAPYIGIPVVIITLIAHFYKQRIVFNLCILEDSLQYWTSSDRINQRQAKASAFDTRNKLATRIGQVYIIEFKHLEEINMNLAGNRLIFSDDRQKKCFIDFTTEESKAHIQQIYEIVQAKRGLE